MNTFSALPPILMFLMLGAVSAGALYNLWIWLHRRHDTLHLWAAGWCAITGSYLVSHYVQLERERKPVLGRGGPGGLVSGLDLYPHESP